MVKVRVVSGFSRLAQSAPDLAESMVRQRHRLFVDVLGWRALARPDSRDVDAYDGDHAHYVLVTDGDETLRASARLLPTAGPHMLADVFRAFVDGSVPRGPHIFEWSRHAPGDPDWPAAVNEAARLALHLGVLDFCLTRGVTALTALMDRGLVRRARSYGWDCTPLGPPRAYGEGDAVAVLNSVKVTHRKTLQRRVDALEAA
jgi:acyl-homoserine lactone synthase